jgi:hypothetical protein
MLSEDALVVVTEFTVTPAGVNFAVAPGSKPVPVTTIT